jgi:hypothetical protein
MKIRKAYAEEILEKKNIMLGDFSANLDKAEKLLFSGNVVGIDGTVAKHNMLSGMR